MKYMISLLGLALAAASGVSAQSCWKRVNDEGSFSKFGDVNITDFGVTLAAENVNYCNKPETLDIYLNQALSPVGMMCVRGVEAERKYCGSEGKCCTYGTQSQQVFITTNLLTTTNRGSPALCTDNTFVRNVTCAGKCCTDVTAGCMTIKDLSYGEISMTTVDISNANFATSGFCASGTVGTGLTCKQGGYDNCAVINMQCRNVLNESAVPVKFAETEAEGCYWTANFSEEGANEYKNIGSCNNGNAFLRGLSCSGSKCDNMSAYCCPKLSL